MRLEDSMTANIKKIGELFQQKRQEKNVSLKEVENATSIRASYLEAIEQGEVTKFLSSVYYFGFIRQYASYLEIDMEALVRDNPETFTNAQEKYEFDYGIGTLEARGSMGGGVRWLPNLLWGAAFIAIVAAGYYVAKTLGVF